MKNNLVQTSYDTNEVTVLLQDVSGKVPVLDTPEREKLNQQGVHYSEMLPVEYVPSEKYLNLYKESLNEFSYETALAVGTLSEKLIRFKGTNLVLVSLARAGLPVGILVKRYLKEVYEIDVPHYSISIIRGKGIDVKAMEMITDDYEAKDIVFVDGWVGKGAINKVLKSSCQDLQSLDYLRYKDLNSELAVLSDPANVTSLFGTREDFLIPSACLNSTVSGLISRTVKTKDMTDDELHGAVYYKENEESDLSEDFLTAISSHFTNLNLIDTPKPEDTQTKTGLEEVYDISNKYNIKDINKIKPGVGETTRVLLRRVPDKVLISEKAPEKYIKHILQLAKEKDVPVEYYPLERYNVCGIIKDVADL